MDLKMKGCSQIAVAILWFGLIVVDSAEVICSTPSSSVQGTSCFLASRFYTTWTEAYSFCSSVNCSLAAPENTVKISEIKTYARRVLLHYDFYLGGTDANSEGTFVQAGTGTPLFALNWASGEPTGGSQENCILVDHVDSFTMYDTNCKEKRRFICDCPAQKQHNADNLL